MKFFLLSALILINLNTIAFASDPTEHIDAQTIVAKPEKGFYLEPFAEFGQSKPTDGGSPKPSYSFGLNIGFMQASNLWTRLEPSFEIFSKALNSANKEAIIPVGGMFRFAYAYRISPGLYAGPALGIGMGMSSYQETRSEIKYESSSQSPVQAIAGQFLIDFIASKQLSFRTGLKVSHYLISVDEIESNSNTIKLDNVHFNCFELVFGLRLKFSS
ncbi:MAG: hypothetical protein AB8G05_22405 [Oligoflexales bacterium]